MLTLSIIKPDAVSRGLTNKINSIFKENGLNIVLQKSFQLNRKQAEEFYAIHKEQPFYIDLCDFMISGLIIVQVLEGSIEKHREIIGIIRKDFSESILRNLVHGSDSIENAMNEILFFFKDEEKLTKISKNYLF